MHLGGGTYGFADACFLFVGEFIKVFPRRERVLYWAGGGCHCVVLGCGASLRKRKGWSEAVGAAIIGIECENGQKIKTKCRSQAVMLPKCYSWRKLQQNR